MRSLQLALACMLGLLVVMSPGCSDDDDFDLDQGPVTDVSGEATGYDGQSKLPDGYGPLWPCTTPGAICNAHDPCAINPICGPDKKCRPSMLQDCDDKLSCTVDKCLGLGQCSHTPVTGYCALPTKVAAGSGDGGAKDLSVKDAGPKDLLPLFDGTPDAGTTETIVKCFKDGETRPEDPCVKCDSKTDALKWSAATGGTCNDGDLCTKDDTCTAGQCKGTYFGNLCADNLGCTKDICDGKGGCLYDHPLLSDYCLISNTCYKDGTKHPSGTCYECDVTVNQKDWTLISNSCQIDSKCWASGDKNTGLCGECDPKTSTTSWTVKGNECLISGVCKKSGDKDTIGCSSCDPTKNKYDWTPLSGVCKIYDKCYQKGDKNPGLCGECDPQVSATSFTVKGNECLIEDVCKKSGDKDSVNCSTCDPTKNKYAWTPISGLCKISGTCYSKGDKHPQLCAECDPTKSATSWTVTGNECLIYNVCKKSGEKDQSGCSACDPTKSKYAWTALPGLCSIDGQCYSSGDQHPKGCGTCDPTKSTTAWTVTGTGCLIADTCVASGASHSSGCGTCNPTQSKTAWTITGTSCIIGDKCISQGTKETVGCGTCDPTKSKSAWTKPSGCLATHAWSKAFGGSSSDYPYGVATDQNGNVYITGYFYYNPDFGGGPLPNAGSYDVYLASYTPSGKHRWSKSFGSTSGDYGYGIAVDAAGNVYITGYFYYSINFGGTTLNANGSSGDIFIASFDSSGKHRWSKAFGNSSSDYGYGLATDPSGNVYLTGYYYTSVNFGGSTLTSNGSNEAFIASFDTSGNHRWSKSFGGTSSDYGYAVATDASGNVFLTGYFYNTIDFGGGTLTSAGSYDMYLASFTSTGTYRWAKIFGSTSGDYGYGVATDPSGNVFLTGAFYYNVDFGGGTLTNSGSTDIVLASYTNSGSHRWSKALGSTSSDYGYGVDTDSSGNVFITGYFYYNVDFGGGTLTNAGSYDAFVASYTNSGAHRWSRSFGSTSSDQGRAIAADNAGHVYSTGYFYYNVDFGGGPLTNAGSYDVYLVKHDE